MPTAVARTATEVSKATRPQGSFGLQYLAKLSSLRRKSVGERHNWTRNPAGGGP